MMPGRPYLVVVFNAGTDLRARNRFLAEEVDDVHRGRTGMRRGIRALVITDVGHYAGYVVGLDPAMPELERQRIKEHMAASRFVYGVFENVPPEQIVLKGLEPLPAPR